MGKVKGKRAWRKNIDVGEGEYLAKKLEDARTGGAVDELPDDALFFVDNDGGLAAGGGVAILAAAPKSRKEKARAKVLRVDSILTKQPTTKNYPVPVPRGAKGPPTSAYAKRGSEALALATTWNGKGGKGAALVAAAAAGKLAKSATGEAKEKISGKALYKPVRRFKLEDVIGKDDPDAPMAVDPYDIWNTGPKVAPIPARDAAIYKAGDKAADAAFFSRMEFSKQPIARGRKGDAAAIASMPSKYAERPYKPSTRARAVPVDHAGCSYNPPEDARQEVIAAEVGALMSKQLKKQLDPIKAPVSNNEANALLAADLYYAQETMYEGAEEGGEMSKNAAVTRDGKMTKAQRNKQGRRREQEKEEEANRVAKRHRRDLSNLKALNAQLSAAEVEAADKVARRNVARDERKDEAPNRLGKHLYEGEHAQVLLTDELSGTIRKLPGCHTLLRDRLKSLQRREMVEPRKKVDKVKSKSFIKYEPGAKGEKEAEMHESMLQATMASRKMRRAM